MICLSLDCNLIVLKISHVYTLSLSLSLQWLPLSWRPQAVFVIYRWVVQLYFLFWFVIVAVDAATSLLGFKCFIYVSYWAFLLWNVYLLYAAVATTMAFRGMPSSQQHTPTAKEMIDSGRAEGKAASCQLQNKSSGGGASVVERLHWLLFTLGNEAVVSISILFWVFFHGTENRELLFNPISLHVHLVSGIVALVDLCVASIPVCLTHAVYIALFGATYVVFTGVYYALNGTDPGGHPYIYPMLNYESNPVFAAGLAVGCVLGYLVLVHLVFFGLYLARAWASGWVQRRCFRRRWRVSHRYTAVHGADPDSASEAESYIMLPNIVSEYVD